jgi:hypothetical protein
MGGRLRWPVAALLVAVIIVGALASLWFAESMRRAAGADPLFGSAIQAWMIVGSGVAGGIVLLALLLDSRRRPPPPQFFPPSLLPETAPFEPVPDWHREWRGREW